ncbi:DUF3375 domain-containing protein [Brenneria corticis]|uniref:DUF3375 domain-containing protein n=1 Tax=Brenneria corticis TaxID=2173106 RepID=UPI001FEFD0E2|nr:DUF3375 domain-containing protein [Brenneria sp. CFCC 11842]
MDSPASQRANLYIHARYQHPAWLLLASRRAPLVLGCLQTLFDQRHDGVPVEDAIQSLADILASNANQPDFEINGDNYLLLARKELRSWIKKALIVEREGAIFATDALETALNFTANLQNRLMTSTASRLMIVQREIENLETHLNPDPEKRAALLKKQIIRLEKELKETLKGDIPMLSENQAVESIREIYNLASGLRADFRRVEDSWRQADRQLRQAVIGEQQNRGEIIDSLLNGHDALLETPEGQVFQGFQQQLSQSLELEYMKQRLRNILEYPAASKALDLRQRAELRWLTIHLVKESAAVIRTRARSERDVKGFIKTGLAAEHHRVGALLAQIFQQAQNIRWEQASIRRSPGPLPPVAVGFSTLPLIERLRFKSVAQTEENDLELSPQQTSLNDIEDDFWLAFNGLDREALIEQTLDALSQNGGEMSIAQLAQAFSPEHDLETLALWLSMAREAGLPLPQARESVVIHHPDGTSVRFTLPAVRLQLEKLQHINREL